MGKLKKTADKGIAYFKKNGFRALLSRGAAKARLARACDYGDWLKRQRPAAQVCEKLRAEYADILARIRLVTDWPQTQGLSAMQEPDGDALYLFLAPGGSLEESALLYFAQAVADHPGAELFYGDSDCSAGDGGRARPCFKPDFDGELLYSVNYIGAGYLASGKLLARLCGDRSGEEPAAGLDFDGAPGDERAALYGLLLACAGAAAQVVHIPRVLYHDAMCARDPRGDEAELRVLNAYFRRSGLRAQACGTAHSGIRRVVYPLPDGEEQPLVSVLIPNKDNARQLSECLDGIARFAGYGRLEILILENNSAEEETFALYERLEREGRARILKWEGAFDFSRINNFGAEHAGGEYLLFLNNDTKMCREDCVAELLRYAVREDVGAVGAKLLYPDGRIQHAGVIVGYGGVAGHAFEGFDRKRQERTAWIQTARQYSAVTAACMMVRKELFLSLGGFCEELGVAYNDVDLCLRIREQGKKVIYNPYAELIHYESQTRGLEMTSGKAERVRKEAAFFCARWKSVLEGGDPFYNPNLTLEKPDFSLARGKEQR